MFPTFPFVFFLLRFPCQGGQINWIWNKRQFLSDPHYLLKSFSASMIIRLALYFWAVGVAIYIAMSGLYYLGWLKLSKLLLSVGTEMLFASGVLLLSLGFRALLKTILQQLLFYFSPYASVQRRLWCGVLKRENCTIHHAVKTQQYLYIAEFKRKRLLQVNNVKHSRQLYKNIRRDIKYLHNSISKQTYQQLQQQSKRYIRQYDAASLVKLQQQLFSFM